MSRIVDLGFNGGSQSLQLPESLLKLFVPPAEEAYSHNENKGVSTIPADILDAPKEYIYILDIPGVSKSDVQVTVEDEYILVVRSNGKRKHEDGEEEGCKYLKLERRAPQKLMRKFRLRENANVGAITAKCENGVLTVVVGKLPPPPNPKRFEVSIS